MISQNDSGGWLALGSGAWWAPLIPMVKLWTNHAWRKTHLQRTCWIFLHPIAASIASTGPWATPKRRQMWSLRWGLSRPQKLRCFAQKSIFLPVTSGWFEHRNFQEIPLKKTKMAGGNALCSHWVLEWYLRLMISGKYSPKKTRIAPKKWWLQNDVPLKMVHF